MKLLVIGNPDAVWGFALAGVHGQIATSSAEVNAALDVALDDEAVGIVLVTEDAAELARARMDQLRLHSTIPLVVEIPAPAGPQPDRPSLSALIQQATGVRI